jgi:two-component system sensor histidine kinase HydH
LQADCGRLKQGQESLNVDALGKTTDQLLDVALDLKRAVTLFRELIRAEQEETVDVNQVLQRSVLLLRPIARRHRVRIELEPAPGLPPVTASAVRLQQIFVNLMLNAVQHTAIKMQHWPEGRGSLQISTAWEQELTRPVQVRFTDNGPGIHRQLWEKIFALGFSTRPQGTGLGLFIARSLVASMDGTICVEQSPVPSGATLVVQLPAARSEM